MRPAFGHGFWLGGALAGAMTATQGALPAAATRSTEPDAEQELIRTDRAARYPAPDGKLTFDKLSSVFASREQDARRPAEPHPRPAATCRSELAELWVRMCPAHVYEVGEGEATAR